MTQYLLDVASYQGSLLTADVVRAGFDIVNLKISHGLGQRTVHPDITGWVSRSKDAGLGISTFHYLTGDATGAAQATYAYNRLDDLGLLTGTGHIVDVENNPVGPNATERIVQEYVATMQLLLGRRVAIYTGDWWWQPKGWNGYDMTPLLHAAPNAGYPGRYPGDTSAEWHAGYGGWDNLSIMQYAVEPLTFANGTAGTIDVSKSALRDPKVWQTLTGGVMADWELVASLIALRSEFNRCGPGRDKSSDGSIGDAAHQAEVSDHNPDETGNTGGVEDADSINEVHAIDVDMSGPWLGDFTMEKAVQYLVAQCRAGREKRLRYIIYNRRIWSASSDWVQKAYTGSNPHDKHAHFSAAYGSGAGTGNPENDTSSFGLEGLIDMAVLDDTDVNKIVAALIKASSLGDGTNSTPVGNAVFNQGIPNPFNAGKRSNAYVLLGNTASAVRDLTASVAALRAENAAQEAATAKLVQSLIDIVSAGGGDVDSAAILAKLGEIQGDVLAAGDKAADAVLKEMKEAAQAQADALGRDDA